MPSLASHQHNFPGRHDQGLSPAYSWVIWAAMLWPAERLLMTQGQQSHTVTIALAALTASSALLWYLNLRILRHSVSVLPIILVDAFCVVSVLWTLPHSWLDAIVVQPLVYVAICGVLLAQQHNSRREFHVGSGNRSARLQSNQAESAVRQHRHAPSLTPTEHLPASGDTLDPYLAGIGTGHILDHPSLEVALDDEEDHLADVEPAVGKRHPPVMTDGLESLGGTSAKNPLGGPHPHRYW